jgi:hypothetical protein
MLSERAALFAKIFFAQASQNAFARGLLEHARSTEAVKRLDKPRGG